MIDWAITNIGGVIMGFTFLYVIIRMALEYLGKFLCYLEYNKTHIG